MSPLTPRETLITNPLTTDSQAYPHPSRRTVVYGRHGMVATAEPQAAAAGLRILQQGGNAIDAAIATAAALTVVEPTSNGLGSDAFAIVWSQGKIYGLNSSGPAPRGLTREWVRAQGHDTMPAKGWCTVTVPGAPAAWATLTERFGNLSLAENLNPAVQLARDGYPVAPTVAYFWNRGFQQYKETLTDPEYNEWFRIFAPNGRAPHAGEIWRSPGHADSLQQIGETNANAYYHGALAAQIAQFARETGGVITQEDLARYQPEWVDPLSVDYHGYQVWELPPNGQGLIALMALKMLEGLNPATEAERIHYQIEAIKLGFADALQYLTDPRHMPYPAKDFLSDSYIAQRRSLIGPEAQIRNAGVPKPGGTVYIATADGEGNMVSYIQSNYAGFGSGLVVPETGISLQNRGSLFSLDESHPNALEPGKRPFHTIIPGFLTHNGVPIGPFGVMGGFMQPQGHVQIMSRVLEDHMNPQAALDAPRFHWQEGNQVVVEHTMPAAIIEDLISRGHEVTITEEHGPFGRGEIIWKDPEGVLVGGTEPRADGTIAAY